MVSLIVRGGTAIAPDANTRIRAGDQVLIVTTEEAREATEQRIRDVVAARTAGPLVRAALTKVERTRQNARTGRT